MLVAEMGIYFHIPFCRAKCHYCDFNSYPVSAFVDKPATSEFFNRYREALVAEMEQEARGLEGEVSARPTSVYFGGGTPSFFGATNVISVLQHCRRYFSLAPEAEVTIEANPDSVCSEGLARLREAGFNRLSLGIQSLDDEELAMLGRVHSANQACLAFAETRQAGFDNVSVDLILGLPGQTLQAWQRTLGKIVELGPEHISAYCLTVEPDTRLHDDISKALIPDICEDAQADMYDWTRQYLVGQGYEHYEISNFARRGRRSRHNVLYWQSGDYLSFGAGAHSHFQGRRSANFEAPDKYMEAIEGRVGSKEWQSILTPRDKIAEAVLMGLRLTEGLNLSDLEARLGVSITDLYGDEIQELRSQGLICLDVCQNERSDMKLDQMSSSAGGDRRLRLTSGGLLHGNKVFRVFC